MKKTAKEIFLSNGGQLRLNEAIKQGINRYTFYVLRDQAQNFAQP